MAKLKPERHHWWPKCVSRHWADPDGFVHWLLPDGTVRRSTPDQFGAIRDGHNIRRGPEPGVDDPWDESYERAFDRADSNFQRVLAWLDELERADPPFERPIRSRILPASMPDALFGLLIECLVSLAVRSPMYRELSVSLAEKMRGPIPERERNVLIGLNIRHAQRDFVRAICGGGKALVIFSPEREFIFGDGFCHNLTPPAHALGPKILVPLTPWLSVLFIRPISYRTEPRIATLVNTPAETDALNFAVQVYASKALFYRSERPTIVAPFARGQHLRFSDHRNSVDQLMHFIPGVPTRDTSLDAFFASIDQTIEAD